MVFGDIRYELTVLWATIYFSGFEKGYISIDGDDTLPTMSGVMPDTSYVSGSDNIKLKFCCRNDRDTYDPMKLPTSSPFILLQEFEGGCQEVIGKILS